MTLTVRADKGASTLQKPLLESSEGEIQGGSVNPITKLPDGPYPPIAEARARLNRNLRWYRCPLPAETLRDCMQRSDFEGWKQTLGHLGLWFSTLFFAWGVWRWNFYDNSALSGVFMSQTTAEGEIHPISQDDPLSKQEENAALTAETGPSGPSFLSLLLLCLAVHVHGLIGSHFTFACHELGHGTVFKTKQLNTAFLHIFSIISWWDPVAYAMSHAHHHRYTQFVHADRENLLPIDPSGSLI